MGAYRLLLALLVAIGHMRVNFFSYGMGVFAVVSFFIISGFVMTALIDRNYPSVRLAPQFYLDRAMRLYPQFLFYFSASCTVLAFLPDSKLVASLPGAHMDSLSAENILPSLAIIPLGFWMYGLTTPSILPPAWSLGLEGMFYLIFPLLLAFKLRMPVFLASLALFGVAFFGYINTLHWTYFLLPGVLFMFLCGSYLYQPTIRNITLVIVTCLVALVACVATVFGLLPRNVFNVEVTAGVAFGVPAVYVLSKLRYSKIDEFLGNISYGVFLNHFVVMYAFEAMGFTDFTPAYIVSVVAVSLVCSFISYYLVERPALKWRHAIRARNKAAKLAVAPTV